MATEDDNQEPSIETIIHKTSSVAEPDKHHETVLKHYEAENVKEPIEGDDIDKLPSVGKATSEKLLSSSSEPNSAVEICDKPGVSESLDGEETEEPVSKSLGVKETEGQLPTSSDGKEAEGHLVDKGELNTSQQIQLMTEETVGQGYKSHNGGTDQVAKVNESELKEENKVQNLSSASTTLDSTDKTASSEPVTFEDHISRRPPQESSSHTISSGEAEKELHMASASEDLHSNLEGTESRGDTKEEITNNEKIGSDAPIIVTLKSDNLSELNKEEAQKSEEMNACLGTASTVAPIEETCETSFRSEADVSSSDIKETVSLVGQSETVEKERHTEISLSEAPSEAKDETIDPGSTKEKQPIEEKNVSVVDLNEEDKIHLYATAKGQHDAPPLVHETEASEGTQLAVEEAKVMHNTDEADRKLESSDLGMPLTEGASFMDLAPPCQINAGNLETESRLINNDLSEEDEIHLYDKAKGQQDAPPVVHETKASEGTQLSVEEPMVIHSMDESDRKLDSSDLGMPLTEGERDLYLAPACQVNDDNIETESRLIANDLNKEDEIHPYDMAKGQQDAPPPFHETDASTGTQLSIEDPKVLHKMDESDRKPDSSDIGMPLHAGASGIDLAPPCQIDADNVETESRLIENDLNEKAEIHLYDKTNGQQDSSPLVHETEASEGTQVSVEEPKIMHNGDVSDRKLESNVIELPLTEGESGIDLAPPCQMDADNLKTESRLIENDLNEEAAIHLYDNPNGQQDSPPLVHETEASKGTQLSVEEPKIMHNIDVSDRELDSSDIRLPLTKVHDTEGSEATQLSVEEPNIVHHIDEADGKLDSSVPGLSQTEGAPAINLAPPCQIDADNLETGLNMDSIKELEIIETNTEEKLEEVADSLVESRNLSIANDSNSKVTKEEIEFDSSNTTLSDEKRDELKVQQSEPSKAPQKPEATDQGDGKQSNINDNINQNSKPEEHEETDTKEKEAEEINSPITDKEHTTSSYSAILTTEGSKVFNRTTSIEEPDSHPELSHTVSTDSGNIDEFTSVDKELSEKLLRSASELSKASVPENATELISDSLEGKEIQGPVVDRVDRKETEGHASEISDGKETEGCGSKSSDGKETQDYHVEKGECNSTQEMHTEEILGKGQKGPNGGIEEKETDVDNTEKITSVGSVTFQDQLSKPSIEEDSNDTISSSITKKELYIPSASEDIIVNVEDIESRAMEEDIINNEKIALDAPVNVALKSDHLGSPLSAPPVTPIEEAAFTSLGSEADVEGFAIKGITSLDEQDETEEKGISKKINLPDVPTEARKDENLDASSSQENQSFDDKSISADDLKEEDGTNQYDSPKGQPVASSLIHETEVCEENQISAEEPEEMHNINKENTMPHSSNLGMMPIEGASDMHMTPDSQIDADKAESEIDSIQELHINAESNTKDKLQQNDADSETIIQETHFHSSSTMPTARITDENIKESEYREDSQMEGKSEAKEDLGDGKEEYTNDKNQNSELQRHGETDISNKEDEEITNTTDKEQIIQIYPEILTTEESKKTNEEAASECENTKVNSPNKEEGTEDEHAASVKEKDLLDGLATPEEVTKASIEEDEENGTKIKEEHCDQVITPTKISADEDKLEKPYGGDKGKEENVVISQASKIDESSKEISSISESDVKEHGDETYLAEHSSRTDTSCEGLPTISSTVTEEHSGNSNLESHVTNGSVKRMEDQGTKSDDHQIEKGTCENVEVMHENFTNESSQVPEYIEKNDHIIKTPKDIEGESTLNELHSVAGEDIPSHEKVKEVGLASLQSINTIDSENKAEEIHVPVTENSKTEEMKEGKEQVQGMKITSLQNVEKKDSDEKSEGRVLHLTENSNIEPDSSTTEVAQGDKEPVQETSNVSLQNIDTMDTDEKSEVRILQLTTNSITEQESSTAEVPKETKGDEMHIQDMTNMIIEKSEEASSRNFIEEPDDCNDKADALVKKESSPEDNDEKTVHVDSTDMDNKNPLRINSSCEKVDEVEIEQLERTSGSVYQTESEIKQIISERIEMETTNEQVGNKDEGQQNREGIEEISDIIHGNDDDVEDGHITSTQTKPEATNELQETCGVQHREEQELENLDSIKGTIHEGEIAVGGISMTSSEEECLLKNDSHPPELRKASVEGMHDQSKLEEDNIYKENSEDTGAEMSSPDPNFLASESSTKDLHNVYESNVTVTTGELQESKEATDLKSDMSPGVLESEAKLHHADVPSETIKGGIKEGALLTEIGSDNISKEEMAETESIEDNISREKVKDEGAGVLEREAIPEEPQSKTIKEMSETTNKEDNNEKVSSNDINIIQSEKDRGDDEYEKSFKGNSGGENRSITGDFPVTDTPGSNEVGENPELLAEGHKRAEGSSIENSEEDRRNIIHDETNENNEYTSDESKTIEQESTTIRPVNDPTLDLAQGPEDNYLSDPDKGESVAQISEVHDDYLIKDVAEKEESLEHESRNNENNETKSTSNLAVSSDKDSEEKDPGESKPMISSKDKDIPLESGSTSVTDLEEAKQVYSSEAVPEPNNTGSAERKVSHDHKETADSPRTASELGQGFAEENIHEPGDTDSRDPHEGTHAIQHVEESSMRLQEGGKDVESTHQTAELTLASRSTSESLSAPEVGSLIVSSPKDCKDVSQMQEEIAAEGNRITDKPEEMTEKLLPAEISEESTREQADHPDETNKLKTQPAGGEAKPDNAEVEKEEHGEQKEGNSGFEVVFIGEKHPDEDAKVEKEEHGELKDGNSGSKVVFIGEKDQDENAKVEKEEHGEQKEHKGSEVVLIGEKDPDEDAKVEKEEITFRTKKKET
ncbi:hypothetical protein Leryth_009351 [Lithospermum erythrorhizon]|nr:hypothetical protein Leryth_009351 [Lithospermum erythrorhizon]